MGGAAYEKILKAVLDDRTLTDAECRLVCYLAARPPGWTIYPALVQKDLKRSLRHWVLPTLKLLHARGWVTKHGGRIPGQANSVLTYRLNRDMIVKPSDLGSAQSDTTPDLGSAGSVMTDPVTTETAGHIKKTDLKENRTPPEPLRGSVPPKAKRGTRIPEDFLERLADRTDENRKLWAWFRENCPDVDGQRENQKFMNHWTEKTGQGATKITWIGTWRNWMLRAQQDAEQLRPRQRPQQPDDDGWVQPVSPFRGLS